ncbi:MAG: rod shape-determining protein RodA [Candidatus Abyssobacteria bacterium SURF_17]|uniref:Peptidoglycan glycosyltransferase RodA n=1 Tax=Candidatus Abyssobacteria bacterium SURF_17 TaxID=2093361 RepID=A0A419F451_9BACT|nr:MAG: rod shape-determining protein RodA [Candidatus Abyssubacteria bacterium SURF_17]
MKVYRQIVRGFDYVTLTCALLLVLTGLLTVFSSAYKAGLGEVEHYFSRQMMWALLGLAAMMVAIIVDYRFMARFAYYFYAGTLALLVFLLFTGKEVQGAQRWIRVMGVNLQPSEFVKVSTLFVLARYLDDVREDIRRKRFLVLAIVLAGVPSGLIVLQPDLGTGLVLVALLGGMLFAANANPRHLLALVISGFVMVPVFWHFLKDYQKARLLSFVNPNVDPLGSSYQVIQSKIAVGAGGLTGKGLLAGTQSQLNFLPEQHTDFIFSVFAEQWGFLGSCVLVALYLTLLFQSIKIARASRDFLGSMLVVGIITIMAFQVLVNLLMTVGLMPVTGIPLPFMSYGGSNLLAVMACVGLLLGVNTRSHIFL